MGLMFAINLFDSKLGEEGSTLPVVWNQGPSARSPETARWSARLPNFSCFSTQNAPGDTPEDRQNCIL